MPLSTGTSKVYQTSPPAKLRYSICCVYISFLLYNVYYETECFVIIFTSNIVVVNIKLLLANSLLMC